MMALSQMSHLKHDLQRLWFSSMKTLSLRLHVGITVDFVVFFSPTINHKCDVQDSYPGVHLSSLVALVQYANCLTE